MRRMRRPIAATIAAGAALMMGASAALAATEPLSGIVTGTSYTIYNPIRTTTQGTQYFTASNLIDQGGGVNVLNLRTVSATSATYLSPQVQWTALNKKTLANLAQWTNFRMAACCKSPISADDNWAGTLEF